MNNALISVIIPVFNQSTYITETVNSVLCQSYSNLEVIIVDDGSTDGLEQKVKPLIEIDNRISYIFQQNQGVSVARNNGFRVCRGEHVAFLDADDIWLADNLEIKLEKFQSDDYGLVHSDASLINDKSEDIPGRLMGNEGRLLNAMLEWKGTQIPGPSSVLIQRSVILQVGLFDELLSTSADQDFFIRVASKHKIGRVSKVTWKYRIHDNNMHKNISRMEHDVQYVYWKASRAKLFKNSWFERMCFARMYLILAASWKGDGKNTHKAVYFIWKALCCYPPAIVFIFRRLINKWFGLVKVFF
jgi:glycosyltransferase involved in cell wall biosynthesis